MIRITLKKNKEAPLRRFHPWVFSGAVHKMERQPTDGDLVEVFSQSGQYLATGLYQQGSICVRVISFQQISIDAQFWKQKIAKAYQLRQKLGLTNNPSTNCYRLIHAEGDELSGLIIDIYGRTAVLQCHSVGMHRNREAIILALKEVYQEQLEAIYDKSADSLPERYAAQQENGYCYGSTTNRQVQEYGHSFQVDWETGQKTGFFLDQRENRNLLGNYAPGKSILNTFCYSGGFSIYGLKAGASRVDSVDVSKKAIQLCEENVALLAPDLQQRHTAHSADVLQYLKEKEDSYDIMIVDPPAYAKNLKKRHNAVQGYKRLNVAALKRTRPGGLLFTFSCSQVVDRKLFYNTIVAAGIEARRKLQVLQHLSQPPDHPVNIFHPEGSYLKGLLLNVE